jgi:SAM-dependent methyltransferase
MSSVNYETGWMYWDDMVKYSPAPYHRRRLMLELMKKLNYQSVLDIGCGNGEMLREIHRHNPSARLVGTDISSNVIETNRARLPFEFNVLDLSNSTLPQKFDIVICSEVLEHIADYKEAIRNLRKMCGGSLIVTVPSGKIHPIDLEMGHTQHFSLNELNTLLTENGFVVDTIWQWGFPFHSIYKRLINLNPQASMNQFSSGTYTPASKLIARFLTFLFYFNLKRWGMQLVVLAHVN